MAEIRTNGLAKAEKYYTDYGSRARELKGTGREVIGYLSALCPISATASTGRTMCGATIWSFPTGISSITLM
jgi:hypothetical protein